MGGLLFLICLICFCVWFTMMRDGSIGKNKLENEYLAKIGATITRTETKRYGSHMSSNFQTIFYFSDGTSYRGDTTEEEAMLLGKKFWNSPNKALKVMNDAREVHDKIAQKNYEKYLKTSPFWMIMQNKEIGEKLLPEELKKLDCDDCSVVQIDDCNTLNFIFETVSEYDKQLNKTYKFTICKNEQTDDCYYCGKAYDIHTSFHDSIFFADHVLTEENLYITRYNFIKNEVQRYHSFDHPKDGQFEYIDFPEVDADKISFPIGLCDENGYLKSDSVSYTMDIEFANGTYPIRMKKLSRLVVLKDDKINDSSNVSELVNSQIQDASVSNGDGLTLKQTPSESRHDSMVCAYCGKVLKENSKFCSYCGKPVVEKDNDIHYCHKCGYKLLPGSKFCSKCGTSII